MRPSRLMSWFTALVVFHGGGGVAAGAGFAIVEQSAVAGGTGGAGVARARDPAVAWFNPAAAASSPGLRASAGLLVMVPKIDAAALDGSWSQGLTSPAGTPPHVYVSYTHRRLAVGASFNVPFGTSVSWPAGWPGRFQAVSSQLQVFRVAPFVGWSFGPLRIAAGLHADVGTLQVRRQLDFVDAEGELALRLSAAGLGGHAALHIEPWSWLSLGATYKSRTVLDLDGSARFEAPLAFSGRARDQSAGARYTLPDLIVVGAEVRPLRRLTLLLDLGITLWTVYDRLKIDFQNESTPDVEQLNLWGTRVSVRGGGEYEVLRWLTVRLGLFYDPTPVPGETLVPSSPDSNRLGVTTGLGVALPWNLHADAFYGYVHMLGQPAQNPENLQARYEGKLHLCGIDLRYAWSR